MSDEESTQTPQKTPQCCDCWPEVAQHFSWMRYLDFPDFLTMCHINIDGRKLRVNFCPSCGADRRDVNELFSELYGSIVIGGVE